MSADHAPYMLAPLRAEFRDTQTEQAFRRHVQPSTVRHLRIALAIWAILLLLFGLLDYQALGLTDGFYLLMGLRLLQAAIIVGLMRLIARRPDYATWGVPLTLTEIIGFPLLFAVFFVRPDIAGWNVGVITIVLISIYVFVPNRLVLNNLVAAFGLTGTILSLAIRGSTAETLVSLTVLMLLPVATGYVAARRLQMVQRQEFALVQQLTSSNLELTQEIERRKQLEAELQRQATTDPLTGLFNRRQYEMLFRRERDRCARQGGSMVLGIADLDHFKQINDTHGHDLGDQALQHVAQIFTRALRHSDVVGRFGGEEFILLLPDTQMEQAEAVVERLRAELEASPLVADGLTIRLTATFAITPVKAEDEGIEAIIRRADQGLYEGKRAGRNRVIAAA